MPSSGESSIGSGRFVSGYDEDPRWAHATLWQHAIGVQRSDGSDQRLLLHHYSANPGPSYWAIPWGTPSPDGKVVIFNSNMNGAGRYDLFVAEMPPPRRASSAASASACGIAPQ